MASNQPPAVLFALIRRCRQLWLVALLLPLLLNPLPTAAAPTKPAPANPAPANPASANAGPGAATPASDAEMGLYTRIAAVNVCIARSAGIDFDKAVGIAGETIAQLIHGQHGSAIAQIGAKPLSDAELRKGAINSAVLGAAEICPKQVPAEVMKRVQEALKQANSESGPGPGAGAGAGAGARSGSAAGPGAAAASKSVQPISR